MHQSFLFVFVACSLLVLQTDAWLFWGKRSVEERQAQEDFTKRCAALNIDTDAGLTLDALTTGFNDVDGNNDGTLIGREVELFEIAIDAWVTCAKKIEESRKK